MSNKVAIVDSIGSNLASLIFALNRIGSSFEITDEIDEFCQDTGITIHDWHDSDPLKDLDKVGPM